VAQDHDLKLPLAATAGEQANDTAQEPIQQTHQHHAQSEPITSTAARRNRVSLPHRLRRAGILYAPDYVINSGGALHGIGLEVLGWTRDELDRRLAAIGETLTAVYREADEQAIPTSEAAERLAAARLGS